MRSLLLAASLCVLGACSAPTPSATGTGTDRSDLNRFIAPTGGAAYPQGTASYYMPPGMGR